LKGLVSVKDGKTPDGRVRRGLLREGLIEIGYRLTATGKAAIKNRSS
jgi:hypothetical protein